MKPDPSQPAQANNVVTPSPEAISLAVALLREGQVVGMPTETVYGLAGDGLNPAALARIFEVKQRPLFDPLILHFADAERAFGYVEGEVPEMARKLASKFWPGPLTMVLPKMATIPDLATSGMPTFAMRVPAHPVAQELLRAYNGGPIAAPSANRFGRISPTDAQAVRSELGDAVPLILDGGPCAVGLESTIIFFHSSDADRSNHVPVLMRAGGIPTETIESVIGPISRMGSTMISDEGIKSAGLVSREWVKKEFPAAPGQMKSHYAPRKRLRLTRNTSEIPVRADIGLLVFGKPDWTKDFPGVIENVSSQGDLREAAANFFRALRTLDDHPRVTEIYAASFPNHGLGAAINERLERAAS